MHAVFSTWGSCGEWRRTWQQRVWQHLQLQPQHAAQLTVQLAVGAVLVLFWLCAAAQNLVHLDTTAMSWTPAEAAWQWLPGSRARVEMLGWVLEGAAGKSELALR